MRMTDEETLEQFLRDSAPSVEELVTRALQQGRAIQHVAVVLERGFDGVVRGGCGSRREIGAKFSVDMRLSEMQRDVVAKAMSAGDDAVPTVLIMHQGEGLVLVGVRRLGGSIVAAS